tara:strand:+ start:373 stop:609 length:237 start_codon:yes stop_codon:yes gene_type:complete
MKTPVEAIIKPQISNKFKLSSKNNQAIKADVAGIRKKIETVLLAELCLIRNIKIVKAPNETSKIWCAIAIANVVLKFI